MAVNTSLLMGADFFAKLAIAVISIMMARKLGPQIFGAYETALSLVYALVLYVNLGMNAVIIRSAYKSGQDINIHMGTALFLKVCFAVVVYPCAILVVTALGYSPLIIQLVCILSLFSFGMVIETTLAAIFQARQRIVWIAVAQVLGAVVYGGAAWLVLVYTISIWQLAWVRVAGVLVTITCLWIAMRKFHFARPRLCLSLVKELILCSLPFAMSHIFTTWYFRIDVLLLAALANEGQAGVFAASNRLLGLLFLFPMAFSYALTPATFEAGNKGIHALSLLYRQSIFASMAVGMPVAAGAFFIAKPAMQILFGVEYVPQLLPFAALSWCLPCFLLSSIAMNTLWGAGRVYLATLFFGMGLVANVATDLLLIPNYGAWGAAVGALIGQLVSVIAALTLVRLTLFQTGIVSLLWPPILSSAIMLVSLYGFRSLPFHLPASLLMEVVVGTIIYMLVLLALWKATGVTIRNFRPQLRLTK